VQEILGTPPGWMVRWGTILILVALMVMAWLSWYFRYPEKIEAPITITTTIPPTDVIAEANGYLGGLLVADGDTVQQGQVLGSIQSPVAFEDVVYLEEYLIDLENLDETAILSSRPNRNLVLDNTLQEAYSDFIQAYEEYTFRVERNFSKTNIDRYRSQIRTIERSIDAEESRKDNVDEQLSRLRKIYERRQDMYAKGDYKLPDLENTYFEIVDLEKQIKQFESNIIEKELDIEQVKSEITSVLQQSRESNASTFVRLSETINQLQSKIDQWKRTYLLTAHMDGVVSFFSSSRPTRQYIRQGDALFAILPLGFSRDDKNELIGKVSLPISGSGKVERGQRVLVKLDSYPYQEFGTVEGRVRYKARLPRNNTYAIEVTFPEGLTTSYDRVLNFDQQMSGKAEIITKEKRFIERVFEKLIEVFNR